VTEPERLDLAKPREIGDLLGDAFAVYRRHFRVVFGVALAIVGPVQLIVSGIGLEELTSSYRENSTTAEVLIPTAVSFLVNAPLIAAATIAVLQALSNDARPSFRQSGQMALDVFPQLFLAVVLMGLAVGTGLLLFIVPGIYIAVRLFFVPQSVVIDGARGPDALRASWNLTKDRWWRVFFAVGIANLAVIFGGLAILVPADLLASSTDRQAVSLAGMILTEALTAPYVALVSTLLFYDLRAHRRTVATP
jgi:hypothetical protein